MWVVVELPTGTVTFLFTDVVGSTRRWQERPEAMAVALEVHDEVLRSAIGDRRGYVFSTAGDAFAVAFTAASDAVAGAVIAQRRLAMAAWPDGLRLDVRMGVHVGAAVERGGDYFGPTLNLAARVMSVAHGGQIVLTEEVARLADRSEPGLGLVELGAHSLRDIDDPVVLHQVVADGLPQEFPPLRTSDADRVSLPSARSSFVGRIDEIARARQALDGHRLVTLTGVGGCGKTRLAVEVASSLSTRFGGGVRFVDLARVGEDAGVAEALAIGIGFVPDAAGPVGPQVRRRLGTGTQLLVVDNCEHVIDEVVEQVDALLAECPNVRVLATSREPLDLDGERILRVPPLDLDSGEGRSAAEMLFIARMVDLGVIAADDEPDTRLDDEAIAAVCRRLDGLPLAIELAAARTSVLSPAQILQRLDDRFSLLTGGRRRTRGRHQTLEATIAWSFDLLDDDERETLRRISVMPAAFDLEMAAAVLDRSPGTTLDVLDALVARSLLQSVRDDEGTFRFRLLETVRSYAYDRLAEQRDVEATRDRHAEYVAERLAELGTSFQSMRPNQGPIADDVLAAIDWAKARGNRALATDLLAGGLGVPIARGAYGRALDVAAWATTAEDPLVRSRAHLARGYLAMVADSHDTDPARCADAALESAGDSRVSWRGTAHVLGMVYSVLSNPVVFEEHARFTRAAIERGECTSDTEVRLAWLETVAALWRDDDIGSTLAGCDIDGSFDELTLVNLLGVRLLTPLFVGDTRAIEREMIDPRAIAARRRFLDAAIRGEHWTLSYEAIRGAATAMVGRVDEARSDIMEALRLVGPDRMPGIEEDFLGAFAWACIAAGETTRAAELLADTWVIARSPTTIVMITAAQERAVGVSPDAGRRTAELFRRIQLRDLIRRESRTRGALDDELERLGLAT